MPAAFDARIVAPDALRFLQACQRRVPFHLGGGAALAGLHLRHRLSADVDLFVHDREAHRDLVRALPAIGEASGSSVAVTRDAGSLVRATLASARPVELDVVFEPVPDIEAPSAVQGIVVESLLDLRVNKLTCILSRSEPRDLVDLLFLDRAGFPPERDLALALRKDSGIDPGVLAWLLGQFPLEPLPVMLKPLEIGKHFIYGSVGREPGSLIGSLDGGAPRFLAPQGNSPHVFSTDEAGGGWILYTVRNQFFARPFDPDKATFTGEAVLVHDSVENGPRWSTSTNGLLAFRGSRGNQTQLGWFNRDGTRTSSVADPGVIHYPRISPDGRAVAFVCTDAGNQDIWILDVTRSTTSRFTLEPDVDSYPLWSLDGSRLLYTSVRGSERLLVSRPANSVGGETILRRSHDRIPIPNGLSRDGRWVSITDSAQANSQMMLIAVADASQPVPLFNGPSAGGASISPDGRWTLRSTNRVGSVPGGILVQSLPKEAGGSPASTGTWQISVAGGAQPLWRADGTEIFYVAPDNAMMAVEVESREGFFRAATPHRLFQTRLGSFTTFREYDVSADGQRFLLNDPIVDVNDGRDKDHRRAVDQPWIAISRGTGSTAGQVIPLIIPH